MIRPPAFDSAAGSSAVRAAAEERDGRVHSPSWAHSPQPCAAGERGHGTWDPTAMAGRWSVAVGADSGHGSCRVTPPTGVSWTAAASHDSAKSAQTSLHAWHVEAVQGLQEQKT